MYLLSLGKYVRSSKQLTSKHIFGSQCKYKLKIASLNFEAKA